MNLFLVFVKTSLLACLMLASTRDKYESLNALVTLIFTLSTSSGTRIPAKMVSPGSNCFGKGEPLIFVVNNSVLYKEMPSTGMISPFLMMMDKIQYIKKNTFEDPIVVRIWQDDSKIK